MTQTPFGLTLVTLFPEMFDSYLEASLIGRALETGLLSETRVDPRRYTHDAHRTVDDTPYGGGAGMIMKPEPLSAAIEEATDKAAAGTPRILLAPGGKPLTHALAESLAAGPGLILICGRYEGVDDRIGQTLVDHEIAIGDYVLSGGEVAAMVVIEAVTRLLPGVLGNAASPDEESFAQGLLEYPQFTRPFEWRGRSVPEILRSGDHGRIRDWRRAQALWRTKQRRPELFAALALGPADRKLMAEHPPLVEGPEE